MHVRLLDQTDYEQVMRIYKDSTISDNRRKEARGIEVEKNLEKIAKVDFKFSEAMKRLYLEPNDKDHPMWGAFDSNGRLLVYTGVRLDLPGAWRDGFVFAWWKGDPSVNNVRNGANHSILKTAYDYCEGIGKKRFYWIIEKDRHSRYNALAIKSTTFIDERYDFYTLCEIPKGTKPEIDWVWSMLGRIPAVNVDTIVRAGVLKSVADDY